MRRLPSPPLVHFVRAWTQLHAHPSACPCLTFRFLTFQQTLELNTHPTHTDIQTARTSRCFGSDIVLAATECVSRHNSNRTTFESSLILRKPVGFPGANEMPARQMDMREPQSDPTLGSKQEFILLHVHFLTFDDSGLFHLSPLNELCAANQYVRAQKLTPDMQWCMLWTGAWHDGNFFFSPGRQKIKQNRISNPFLKQFKIEDCCDAGLYFFPLQCTPGSFNSPCSRLVSVFGMLM